MVHGTSTKIKKSLNVVFGIQTIWKIHTETTEAKAFRVFSSLPI